MKITRTTITLLFILLAGVQAFSQKIPNTLLWRITGKGLQKPSYLFGTMHLQDRRLFYFGDSLYHALETSEGYAMELEPNEMMDSVLNKFNYSEQSPLLKDIIDKKKYQKISAKLEKETGIAADKITKKELVKARKQWMYRSKKPDDMLSAVDIYLYNIARQQGKWVGGIEDVADQMDLVDELGKDIDVNQYLDEWSNQAADKYKQTMINAYVKQDLGFIQEMVSDRDESNINLVTRNIKMARRMDSLSAIRNSFFAVGAAHLPGDSGVIKLLEARGFTVTPVFSSKVISPENYKYTKVDLPWYQFSAEDSAYTIEVPAKPTDMKLFGDELKFKVHADMASGLIYMSCFVFSNDASLEKLSQRMKQSFATNGSKPLEEKSIFHKGIEGSEVILYQKNYFYRVQSFYVNNKTYMVMVGSERKEQLRSADAERYFRSFSPNIGLEQKQKLWKDYVNENKGFRLSLPGQAQMVRTNSNKFNILTYAQMDIANSSYYACSVAETEKNFLVIADSIILNEKLEYFNQMGLKIAESKKYEVEGYPALSITASGKNQGVDFAAKLLVISRGNRSYTLTAVTPKGKEDYPDVSRFFRSFSLLPYPKQDWHTENATSGNFSVWAPSEITVIPLDTLNTSGEDLQEKVKKYQQQRQYLGYDSISAVNLNITATSTSRYYQAENDSILLTDALKQYYKDTAEYAAKSKPGNFDSLVYLKKTVNGTLIAFEALVKNASKSYYKRARVIRNGDSIYHLMVLAPYATITNEDYNRFFDAFRFAKEDTSSTIFLSKKNLIIQDIASNDSLVREEAKEALGNTTFTLDDHVLLQNAFLKNYPDDSLDYSSTADLLCTKLKGLNDTANISFVKTNYAGVAGHSKKKMLMLELLSSLKTASSVLLLKELLLANPPAVGNEYALVRDLDDSLGLAVILFPEASKLFSDSLLGGGMISLALSLTDSGYSDKQWLKQYSNLIQSTAKRQIANLKRSPDDYEYYSEETMRVLEIINDNTSTQLLNQFVKLPQLDTKLAAITHLLKLGKAVPAVEVKKLAADKQYRTILYDSLRTVNKTVLFPKEFQTQLKFAESYLFNYLFEEDEGTSNISFKLLAEKTADSNGLKQRYYIFKAIENYEDDKTIYPVICGPFNLNKSIPSSAGEVKIKAYYDETFPIKSMDELFKKFLKEGEH